MKIHWRRETDPGMPPLWPPILGLVLLAVAVVSLVLAGWL